MQPVISDNFVEEFAHFSVVAAHVVMVDNLTILLGDVLPFCLHLQTMCSIEVT